MSTTSMALAPRTANQLLTDHFRCPEGVADFAVSGDLSRDWGYFKFGSDAVCYGQCSSGVPAQSVTDPPHDAGGHVAARGSTVHLPFDPAQVLENLRRERYLASAPGRNGALAAQNTLRSMY